MIFSTKPLAVFALVLGLTLPAGAAEHTVNTNGLVFDPADLTINVGDTVTWNNTGGFHNVSSNTGLFTSGDPSSDPWTFSFTFHLAGDYGYQCDVHAGQGMVGNVSVVGIFGDGFESGNLNAWAESLHDDSELDQRAATGNGLR